MSSYMYPYFVESESNSSVSWSSLQRSLYSDYFIDMSFHNQNPIPANHETLAEAFSRLSVLPNNQSFIGGQGSALVGGDAVTAVRRSYLDDYGSNIGQMQRLYNGNHVALRSPPLMSQKESLERFLLPGVWLSNDDLCFGFQPEKGVGTMSSELLMSANNRGYGLAQQHLTQCSVFDLKGKLLPLAKDQMGCKILQERMKSLVSPEEVSFVLSELIGNVTELMMDPSGNYVFQKLVEICNEEQRTRIILMVTRNNFQLASICLNFHGTRAVQKLVEHVTTQEQRNLIVPALCPSTVVLAKDVNGIHVIGHCLKYFSREDNKFLLDIVAKNCFNIATDKSGCCVIQHCVDHAQGDSKERLMNEIIINASLLAEDCYGNYVVQHLVSLRTPRVIESLVRQLKNKFFSLSCNKFGSNVVEKFFYHSGQEHSTEIIWELVCNPNFSMLLVDPYGNYVIKSALPVTKGPVRHVLSELIERHSPLMRNNLYGKKLLAWFDKWKRRRV